MPSAETMRMPDMRANDPDFRKGADDGIDDLLHAQQRLERVEMRLRQPTPSSVYVLWLLRKLIDSLSVRKPS